MTCGIYRIINKVTGHTYIGSSRDIDARWKSHRAALRRGQHHSSRLQSAFNEYGESAFEFEVVKEVRQSERIEAEPEHLDRVKSWDKVYNMSKFVLAGGRPKTAKPLRDSVYRPAIGPEFKRLIDAIANSRGWSTQHTVEMALSNLATLEEAEKAGLVE